jgi:hypothetical protein
MSDEEKSKVKKIKSGSVIRDTVPSRVRAAMRFIEFCTFKEMKRVIPHDTTPTTLDGMKLEPEESACRTTAVNVLSTYLNGKNYHDTDVDGLSRKSVLKSVVNVVECPLCRGAKQNEYRQVCHTCGGWGRIMLSPGVSVKRRK